jgi:hypothetical protein
LGFPCCVTHCDNTPAQYDNHTGLYRP